jgi:hypothetical protein
MKLSIRLTTLAITAVALAGTTGALGAQQRNNSHSTARAQAPRAHADNHSRPDAGRAHYTPARAEVRGRSDFAPRGEARGRTDFSARNEVRDRAAMPARGDVRGRDAFDGRNDFRGRDDRRVPVAAHGRPLITRAGYEGSRVYGGSPYYGGARFGAGFNRFGGRLVLPLGWESRIVVRGFFPLSYASYCEVVPAEYDYMLPPMQPNYDSCLFGDRIVVVDRFSRGIVFAATLR